MCAGRALPQRVDRSYPELPSPIIFPGPADRGPWTGVANGAETTREVKDSAPVSVFVFKTVADPFAGRVSYFKVVSGVLRNDANLVNSRTGVMERLAHIGSLSGQKPFRPLPEIHAGDIGGVAKLKETLTGDTLVRQGIADRVPGGDSSGAVDCLRDRRQDAQR